MPYLAIMLIVITVLIIALIEFPRLIKDKKTKEAIIFSVLLLAGFVHALVQGLGIQVSSNIEIVAKVVNYIRQGLGMN
jgi:hypothetical protein